MTRGEAVKLVRNVPWHVLLLVFALCGVGLWNLASASRNTLPTRWITQAQLMGLGLGLLTVLCLVDYRALLRFAYVAYGAVVALLIAVLVHGRVVMGARRWIGLGPVNLQPSEVAKLAMVLALARWFAEDKLDPEAERSGYPLRQLWQPFLMVLIPVALTMKQPDLGTALLIGAVSMSMILFARVRLQGLAILGVLALLLGTIAFTGIPTPDGFRPVLKAYQKKRLLTFLDPEADALGAGYHANQSMIAVGSGQVDGKGWGQGTQTQLSFLPEQHTDFIFSVWAEERGFVGGLGLLSLYLLLILSGLAVAWSARDRFGAFIAVGVTAMLFWHVFINIGMVTGTLPVVGVTLPLLSYGGSSVVTVMIGLGLLFNVAMRRQGG